MLLNDPMPVPLALRVAPRRALAAKGEVVCWPFMRKNRVWIDHSDRWFVLLDGEAVAIIDNPHDHDMFWFSWDAQAMHANSIPTDLWDGSTDARRTFRHAETGEIDLCAFPAGQHTLPSGRVVIRGPLRGRGKRLADLKAKPRSVIGRFLQRMLKTGKIQVP
jgi:hypothetical protein